jgi:uncharacterized protein (DUF983 family)
MSADKGTGRALRYLGRALLLRCPVCGISPVFPPLHRVRSLGDWFTPLDGCPRCGYPYEREPGYFLASIWIINYGLGSLLGIFIYVVLEVAVHPPLRTMLAGVLVPVFLFNLLFARHSKTIFIAIDHLYDPHERDPGDDGGDVPKPESPRNGPDAPSKPLPKRKPEPVLR